MSSASTKIIQAAAGNAGEALYVEDVFSTYLYDANLSSGVVVNNGINLLDEGGLIWTKCRNFTADHGLYDSERTSFQKLLRSNTTIQQLNSGTHIQATTTGYTIDSTGYPETNNNNTGAKHVSWTFRKAPKFFDVVTYTGTGVAGLTVSHSLDSVVGTIIVKNISRATDWMVLHRNNGSSYKNLHLNTTNADLGYLPNYWGDGTSFYQPTSTEFKVGTGTNVNFSGDTYVAYLFAHNDGDGEFGKGADQDIIKCGSYTGAGSGAVDVDLGFEPQFVFIKNASRSTDWMLQDIMRGMSHGSWNPLVANKTQAELGISADRVVPTATGFTVNNNGSNDFGQSGDTVIYIAIRRSPMKTPTSGTDVFATDIRTSAEGEGKYTSGFPVDFSLANNYDAVGNTFAGTRLTNAHLQTNSTTAESSSASDYEWDYNDGISIGASGAFFGSSKNVINYMFRRAPGYFDVAAYTGDGTSGRTVSHNLGVAPELTVVKRRNSSALWVVGSSLFSNPANHSLSLNESSPISTGNYFNSFSQNSFQLGSYNLLNTNNSGSTYIAYLFATLPGISKVGSFTTTGSDLNVDCGFTNGARFILFKKTSATEDWIVFNTERGIVAGNDPFLALNTTAAEYTLSDAIDPLSSGFTLVGSFWGSGSNYIFLAIA